MPAGTVFGVPADLRELQRSGVLTAVGTARAVLEPLLDLDNVAALKGMGLDDTVALLKGARLLVSNDTGIRNLVKLSSASFLDGFSRGKANLDMELLSRHSEGVIVLTGCLQSRFCRRLVDGNASDARSHADDLIQTIGLLSNTFGPLAAPRSGTRCCATPATVTS
jgi:hypothetical protein